MMLEQGGECERMTHFKERDGTAAWLLLLLLPLVYESRAMRQWWVWRINTRRGHHELRTLVSPRDNNYPNGNRIEPLHRVQSWTDYLLSPSARYPWSRTSDESLLLWLLKIRSSAAQCCKNGFTVTQSAYLVKSRRN